MPSLKNCRNIADLRLRAKSKLPSPMFHYLDGGAEDEWTQRRNTEAFDDYTLMPRQLRDVSQIDLKTNLLGCELQLPFFIAPTGMSRLFHQDKELAVARAAHKFGTLYSLSTMASTTLENVSAETPGPKMFQIYIFRDRGLTTEFVQRCKAAGYQVLCLTVDTVVAGNRERDLKYGMTVPPKVNRHNFFSYATRWTWLYHAARQPDFQFANVMHRVDALADGAMSLFAYVNQQFDPSITWDDAAWLAEQWDGPFVIKGLQSAEDAVKAREIGASAIMLSNHGGRQLEGAPAPIDCIPAVRDAIGNDMELVVDGGIRRGSHVIKAIALGADACSIGRPYLYGLAAGGQHGVERAIQLLKDEIERNLTLLGCPSIADLSEKYLLRIPDRSGLP
jgi:L-lactate dehydrogenase (cytochrome)